ncbi:MAG: DUF2520 domain-containing protein [Clostridiales bacterium]|nr:DUF2520 domain-containing protein [Clostridiales bacterium]
MQEIIKKIGFTGAGKVGFSLGRHIKERGGDGYTVCGYHSRDIESARAAAAFSGGQAYASAAELAAECDLLLLTVPDGQIAEAWRALAPELTETGHKAPLCVGHCSGSLSAEIFEPKPEGVSFGSMHPLMSIHDRENSFGNFKDAYFTIEGGGDFACFAQGLLTTLGNPFCMIDASQKTLYHAASVMVSNLVCALAFAGTQTYRACGFDSGFAENAWRALFRGNAENTIAAGPVHALTGPVERCDTATVARHLDALTGDDREIYLLLSRKLIGAARQKNPGRDYSELARLLGASLE